MPRRCGGTGLAAALDGCKFLKVLGLTEGREVRSADISTMLNLLKLPTLRAASCNLRRLVMFGFSEDYVAQINEALKGRRLRAWRATLDFDTSDE